MSFQDKEKAEAKELAGKLSSLLNGGSNSTSEAFVEALLNDHRTLQQCFARMVVLWIHKQAERCKDDCFDLRNEGTVKMCKRLDEVIEGEDHYLPFV